MLIYAGTPQENGVEAPVFIRKYCVAVEYSTT